jgi:Zn-dependent M28 family amino/carboxypeptidase
MLLYLSKYFSKNKPKYSLVFMAFGAEEVGILGSKYYVENPLFPLNDIRFVVNCDIMGTGDKGVTVVNGTVHKKEFKKLAVLNLKKKYVSKVKVRGRAANSDHYWFSQRQIPAVFIYTLGGITAYHDVFDKAETLPLTEFSDLSKLLIGFINSF